MLGFIFNLEAMAHSYAPALSNLHIILMLLEFELQRMACRTAKVLSYSFEFLAAIDAYIFTYCGITRNIYIKQISNTAHTFHLS